LPIDGLVEKINAPSSRAVASVVTVSSPLTTITGIWWVLLDTRRRLSTSIPVPPGILMSRRVRSGVKRRAIIHVCKASTAKMISNLFGNKKEACICR
jgi:hypothetical protein